MTATVRRHTLGVIALALLAGAAVLGLVCEGNLANMYSNICLRVGMTLGAAWLAFPQIMALTAYCSPKLLLAILVGGVVVIARPRTFPIVAVMVAAIALLELAGWLLKPLRPPARPPQGKRRS